jgi:hypothetical protein
LAGIHGNVIQIKTAIFVKTEAAAVQREHEGQNLTQSPPVSKPNGTGRPLQPRLSSLDTKLEESGNGVVVASTPAYTRFHGSVKVNPTLLSSEIAKLSEFVIQHLSSLVGAKVTAHRLEGGGSSNGL